LAGYTIDTRESEFSEGTPGKPYIAPRRNCRDHVIVIGDAAASTSFATSNWNDRSPWVFVVADIDIAMQTKSSPWADEKRAYYRLLRHLLSEEVQISYAEDQTQPLPPRMVNLLEALEQRTHPKSRNGT
jgi:hypothetical protein